MDHYLRQVIEGVSNTYGEDFFNAITLTLSDIIHADFTFIARLDIERNISQSIALVAQGELQKNIEYSLTSTPCANVADDSVCIYPEQVTNVFPDDQLLTDMGIEAYIGTPLRDSHHNVIGLIVALYKTPITDQELTLTLFNVFSGRIAAELERVDYESQLKELNRTLEARVAKRTKELQVALNDLKSTQNQLIESEKIAALGALVGSIAHEINTPLGVAITGQSLMQDAFDQLNNGFKSRHLTEALLQDYCETTSEALPVIYHNLQRTKALINNFKQTAVDQDSERQEEINLKDYYEQIMSTLMPLMRQMAVVHELDIPDNIIMNTYPGTHAQILTNLVSNSIRHAFPDEVQERRVKVSAVADKGYVNLVYQDNGIGLTDDVREHIFEPFYTTKRHQGGTGLGMSIIHNAVRQTLEGSIQLQDSAQGFALTITLPRS